MWVATDLHLYHDVPHLFGSANQTKENSIISNFELHVGPVRGTNFSSMTYINRISNISFVHHQFSEYFRNSWRKVRNFVEEKFMGVFTKIDITFSYEMRITKFLARWKACYEGYVVTRSRDYFCFSTISSSCVL